MNQIVFTRGMMGSGKTKFLSNLGLTPWTIDVDQVKLMQKTPMYNEYGKISLSKDISKDYFKLIKNIVEEKMQRKEFIILDSENLNIDRLNTYIPLCTQYDYEPIILDFTKIPLTKIYKNLKNKSFDVSEEEINKAIKTLSENQHIPKKFTVVSPQNFIDKIIQKQDDFSNWKRINHIGDIHGCYTALRQFLKGDLKKDELYIFTGDYLDRGIENRKVLEMMMTISSKPNVIVLEGNHESHLRNYAYNKAIHSRSFVDETIKQLTGIDKKKIKAFCKRLKPYVYYKYKEKNVLVCHGGLTFLPKNLFLISEEQFIKGIGDYKTDVCKFWDSQTEKNDYQIHGHRNLDNIPIINGSRNFNLEGKIEYGDCLRIISLDKKGFEEQYIKNTVVNKCFLHEKESIPKEELYEVLKNTKGMKEIELKNNILCFSFYKPYIHTSSWKKQIVKLNEIFINSNTKDIVARGYDKCFYIKEIKENVSLLPNNTNLKLEKYIKYPVNVYLKEDGYMGITGYDKEFKKEFIASKNSDDDYDAKFFRKILKQTLKGKYLAFFNELEKRNITAIFQVIDRDRILLTNQYKYSQVILLDLVYRDSRFKKEDYITVMEFAQKYGLSFKKKIMEINNEEELNKCLSLWEKENVTNKGYVLEDFNGYMIKYKSKFEIMWENINNSLTKYNAVKYLDSKSMNDNEKDIFLYILKNKLNKKPINRIIQIYYEDRKNYV